MTMTLDTVAMGVINEAPHPIVIAIITALGSAFSLFAMAMAIGKRIPAAPVLLMNCVNRAAVVKRVPVMK